MCKYSFFFIYSNQLSIYLLTFKYVTVCFVSHPHSVFHFILAHPVRMLLNWNLGFKADCLSSSSHYLYPSVFPERKLGATYLKTSPTVDLYCGQMQYYS